MSHSTQTEGIPASHLFSQVLYACFAIPVTIVMINVFWPGGFALAIILASFWPMPWNAKRGLGAKEVEDIVRNLVPANSAKKTGNASFDAYREDVLSRLEQEQGQFDDFLGRLREAKDKSEFDRFMDDRAKRVIDDAELA